MAILSISFKKKKMKGIYLFRNNRRSYFDVNSQEKRKPANIVK